MSRRVAFRFSPKLRKRTLTGHHASCSVRGWNESVEKMLSPACWPTGLRRPRANAVPYRLSGRPSDVLPMTSIACCWPNRVGLTTRAANVAAGHCSRLKRHRARGGPADATLVRVTAAIVAAPRNRRTSRVHHAHDRTTHI